MNKKYTIFLPNIGMIGIRLFDYTCTPTAAREITLKDAKNAVFQAVIREDVIHVERGELGITIHIVDHREFERAKSQWIMEVNKR